MASLSPLGVVVALHGEDGVVVSTPAVGGSASYDPDSSVPFVPSGPAAKTIRAAFYEIELDGAVILKGRCLILNPILPLYENKSTLIRKGVEFRITKARERNYLGKIDGYDLTFER